MKSFAAIASVLAFSLFSVATADFSGQATYFYPGLGSCGKTNTQNDFIVALAPAQNGGGKSCGKKIRVSYGGKTVDATVVDLCPGCAANDVDLSPVAFQKLDALAKGRINVSWKYI